MRNKEYRLLGMLRQVSLICANECSVKLHGYRHKATSSSRVTRKIIDIRISIVS